LGSRDSCRARACCSAHDLAHRPASHLAGPVIRVAASQRRRSAFIDSPIFAPVRSDPARLEGYVASYEHELIEHARLDGHGDAFGEVVLILRDVMLGRWVGNQRQRYRSGWMQAHHPLRIARLEELPGLDLVMPMCFGRSIIPTMRLHSSLFTSELQSRSLILAALNVYFAPSARRSLRCVKRDGAVRVRARGGGRAWCRHRFWPSMSLGPAASCHAGSRV
jgi:hypothetical protein